MSESRAILVVDDDADLRELMVLLLEGAGYRVQAARDGQEALDHVAQEMPALILLDMKMPGMNGWQFAAAFRRQYGYRSPIIVVTAAEDVRKTAQEVEADGFLGKPFDLDDVLRMVAEHAPQAAL